MALSVSAGADLSVSVLILVLHDAAACRSVSEPPSRQRADADELVQWGVLHDRRVEDAMRTVPRHLFVPSATVQAAYAQDGVVTHPGADGRSSVDADALRTALDHPPVHHWLGVNVAEDDVGDVEFWLADLEGFCRLLTGGGTAAGWLVEPMYRWGSMAVVQQDTIGYLTMRPAPAGPGGRRVFELGVCSHGRSATRSRPASPAGHSDGNKRAPPAATSESRFTRPGPLHEAKGFSSPTSSTPASSSEPLERALTAKCPDNDSQDPL
ncbi:hypothetical protein [Actinomadura mexicana]|uniref:hypothetical protein n=1 Tax=Actinomadura mexicana TaxID=134959 RepID=UPI0011788C87|nr:hypothetical protein [Actinomadura mexicana]